MKANILNIRVAGVTYENRQEIIARLITSDPCRLEPEPENPYDANALAVKVSHDGAVYHVGYIPKDMAALIAPHLDGEALMVKIVEITGGFEMFDGSQAAFGLRLHVELPEDLS